MTLDTSRSVTLRDAERALRRTLTPKRSTLNAEMSRPLVLILLSLIAGIFVSDKLFYQQYEIPMWLDVAAWAFCFLVALVSFLTWRRECREGLGRWHFPLLTSFFFVAIGFARYASYASDVRAAWMEMDRPPVNRGNPDEFDYVRWRWIQGVEDTTGVMAKLRGKALRVRASLAEKYASAGLDKEAQAIITASSLGERSQLSRETRDLYADAGASHLLALSGLHLSIIVGFILTLLNGRLLLSRWRPLLCCCVVLFIWTYAFVAGLPASLVRASLMMTLFLIGSMFQRSELSLHWLVVTAVLMLLMRPVYLFDVGAQLSFAAVAGIIVLHGSWSRWAFKRWRLQFDWLDRHFLLWPLTAFSVSLAAQLFTLPLVAYYFHRIPLYAPLFNIVFIPLTTAIIYGGLILLAVSFVPFLSMSVPLISKCLSWLVAVQLSVMQFEVSLPNAVVEDFWSRKATPQVVVYNNWRCPALHAIASPSQSWLLMPEPDSLQSGMRYIAGSFWRRRLTADPVVLAGRSSLSVEGSFSAVMISTDNISVATGNPESAVPVVIDVLWITKGFKGRYLNGLERRYAPRLMVLDATLHPGQRAALRQEAERVGWSVYDVSVQGALRLSLDR